jgi:adenine-specific DNA-methyltransferase
MSKEQKITTDIKVPNKDLEALRINFPHCFDKDGNFQLEKFKNNLTEKEINFSTESYGLDWLGKSYARLLASDPATTLLKADETHNSKPENANSENLLIKGDNLEVLKHLANAYYEKVKMIYIDPPYNTGSDGFVYEDDRKFTVKELQQLIGIDEEKAKRILSFTQQKSNSHSAWLTFMYPRLYIAKQLLKDDGVIFISIDDNEVAQLRLLMDEVFGEENFVAELIWKKKSGGGNDTGSIVIEHEYVLIFTKTNTVNLNTIEMSDLIVERYKNEDNSGKYSLDNLHKTAISGYDYPITAPNGEIIDYVFNTKLKSRTKPNWRCPENTFLNWKSAGLIEFKYDESKGWIILTKLYLKDKPTQKSTSILLEYGRTRSGKDELSRLFDDNSPFDYPKSSKLINHFLQIGANSSDLILDFFAGSGTTGDAVMQLNAEDGGNRKYILVQLPEAIDPKKNKVAYDFVKDELKAEPTIFEITKERLIRASKKINSRLNENITKLKNELPTDETKAEIKNLETLTKQNYFKIFETTPIWEDYDFESTELDNQTKLFDESKLTKDDIKALLTTWKTYDGIALTQELEKVDLSVYTAYYGNGKLYLMDKGFTTDNLKNLLEKIDSDKKFNPTSIIAFGYNFESKNLRELSENVKSYTNKKKIDIDFITRY